MLKVRRRNANAPVPLHMFHSFREAFVISTSQNLLFNAIRSGSGGHDEAAIRQLLSVS